jgi:hypothetical protein
LHAAKFEKALGLGSYYYTGTEAKNLAPDFGPFISFSGTLLNTKFLNLVNHFDFSTLVGGTNFAGDYGSYFGFSGIYQFAFRFNLAKGNILPILEVGPLLGMYTITLSSPPSGSSRNQTAFKYGFTVGTGFDWLNEEKRGGSGGWGMAFHYFKFFTSPGFFDFSAKKLSANGIRFELRLILSSGK